MKINKLVLKNFRSYEEETTFNLNTTSEKNIILIGGKNGAGKSTIFEAIKLCIYGPIAYKYQGFNSSYISRVKSNINNNSLRNSKVDTLVSVDIEISEGTEKNTYTLIRQWTFKDKKLNETFSCLLYNSDAADEGFGLDVCGRRSIQQRISAKIATAIVVRALQRVLEIIRTRVPTYSMI
ncbi:AAA family ATPase, partial [Clostridioides difficile]|uniref:AAA family ATPase n=1 Tax=Clostridioides difficile TaxID=1496 RepID=UPI000BCB4EA6